MRSGLQMRTLKNELLCYKLDSVFVSYLDDAVVYDLIRPEFKPSAWNIIYD